MTRFLTCGMLLVCGLLTVSCAAMKTKEIREECEQSIKGYNRMLRWQEVENAGMVYIEPEQRDEFFKAAESLRKRGVTITDYRIRTQECLPEKGTAEALTEFDYYILPSNRIKTKTYKQSWNYRTIGEKKFWKLKSGLPLFE
jgi:hypothetical protein